MVDKLIAHYMMASWINNTLLLADFESNMTYCGSEPFPAIDGTIITSTSQ